MNLKIPSAKCRPFCSNRNVLRIFLSQQSHVLSWWPLPWPARSSPGPYGHTRQDSDHPGSWWVTSHALPEALRWRHNGRDSVSSHQPRECLLNRLIRCRSKKTSKLRVTGLCAGNSPRTGEFPAQMASYAENVSIWWRHHEQTSPRWWSLLGLLNCYI